MRGGVETLIDAFGCDPARLRDPDGLRALLDRIVRDLDLRVIGQPQVHAFDGPGGVTALYLLTESHLGVHTYPETGVATFNLYCCRERPAWPWDAALREALGARAIDVRAIRRGGDAAP